MSRHLLQPNRKPSFAHTQASGLNKKYFLSKHYATFLALNEGGGDTVRDLSGNGNDGILSTQALHIFYLVNILTQGIASIYSEILPFRM